MLAVLNIVVKLTCNSESSDRVTTRSISHFVFWDDCEVEDVLMVGAGEVRVKGVVCLCEVMAVGTGHGCWVVLVCHIGDEDSVPDVRVHPTHIQRERSTPRNGDGSDVIFDFQVSY